MSQKYLIYLATNLVNKKQYIGQTKVGRLQQRIKEHFRDAANSTKKVAFHNAINKYGIENFSFEEIETNIPEELIDIREQFWIEYYNTYIHADNSAGYNETVGGQGTHGYIFTADDKQKIGESSKNYWKNLKLNDPELYIERCNKLKTNVLDIKRSPEFCEKIRQSKLGKEPWNKGLSGVQKAWNKGLSSLPKICQFDLGTGKLVNIFNNAALAAESLELNININTTAGRILCVCKNKKGHAYNFIWRFQSDYEGCLILEESEIQLEHKNKRAKSILQYDLQNNFISEWESAAAYSRSITDEYKKQRNIAKAIVNVCNGKAKTYNHYIWKYKNITLEGGEKDHEN